MWWVLEAKGVRAGVPWRTISRVGTPMETAHIDLAGHYGATLGGSVCLITFVDIASRWLRPYGMKSTSETTMFVEKFLADMNDTGTPQCFGTENGGEFTSRNSTDVCDSTGIRREYTAPGRHRKM